MKWSRHTIPNPFLNSLIQVIVKGSELLWRLLDATCHLCIFHVTERRASVRHPWTVWRAAQEEWIPSAPCSQGGVQDPPTDPCLSPPCLAWATWSEAPAADISPPHLSSCSFPFCKSQFCSFLMSSSSPPHSLYLSILIMPGILQ